MESGIGLPAPRKDALTRHVANQKRRFPPFWHDTVTDQWKCADFSLIFESKEVRLILSSESPKREVASQLRDSGCDVKLRKMLKIKITVQVEKDGDSFYAYCPGLEGLHVDGSTEDEAIDNAVEAASLYVSSMIRHNDPLPIGTDFAAEEKALRPSSQRRTLSRNVEMPWPSAQACGVN